jgi:hypothetical protein
MEQNLFHRSAPTPALLTAPDLTVLIGLVRRAKVNAAARLEKRKQLHHHLPIKDPAQTKANKLGQLLDKLAVILSQIT